MAKSIKLNKLKFMNKIKIKNSFKLLLSIALLSISILTISKLNLHNSTHAATLPSIFDKSGDRRYFGNGKDRPAHNVLPPIFAFYEGKSNSSKKPYAIDPQRLGLGEIDKDTSEWLMGDASRHLVRNPSAADLLKAIEGREEYINKEIWEIQNIINQHGIVAAHENYKAKYKAYVPHFSV